MPPKKSISGLEKLQQQIKKDKIKEQKKLSETADDKKKDKQFVKDIKQINVEKTGDKKLLKFFEHILKDAPDLEDDEDEIDKKYNNIDLWTIKEFKKFFTKEGYQIKTFKKLTEKLPLGLYYNFAKFYINNSNKEFDKIYELFLEDPETQVLLLEEKQQENKYDSDSEDIDYKPEEDIEKIIKLTDEELLKRKEKKQKQDFERIKRKVTKLYKKVKENLSDDMIEIINNTLSNDDLTIEELQEIENKLLLSDTKDYEKFEKIREKIKNIQVSKKKSIQVIDDEGNIQDIKYTPKKYLYKQYISDCQNIYKKIPWIKEGVSRTYINSPTPNSITDLIIVDGVIEQGSKKWYPVNINFYKLQCNKYSDKRTQTENILTLYTNNNQKIEVTILYKTNRDRYILQNYFKKN